MPVLSRRKLLSLGSATLAGIFLPISITAGAPVRQTSAKFGLPFGGSPSATGWYVRQWYGNTRWAYRQRHALYGQGQGLHFGVDFFTNCGTPVHAIGDGTVAAVDGPYGSAPHNLVIRHANGYASLYGHLQRSEVRVGQRVTQGQVVAISGVPTGADCDTHPHLHLEIRNSALSGTVNPVNLIEADWPSLTLGLPGEGLEFEIDLDNPTRWQTIYDQPAVRFGAALFNDYARPWPIL
jgi:murein DD-endopeptidase MepM/ murein hydrolase activator NlpD